MTSPNQLSLDFAYFLHHSADYRTTITPANLERTCSICLNLLTAIPAAREAIFEYFSSLISISVHCFIQNDSSISSVNDLLTTIETKLIFLAVQSNSWADILAQWSLEQLVNIIIRYANETIVKRCETLSDRLQLWTQCQATMTLIKICSTSILHDAKAADNAVNKYLEASIRTRPAFDWVTVSLCLRCGQTLISRLIQLSLEESTQPQYVHGARKIYAVWSSLEIIAEQQAQLFHQVLMEQIQSLLASDDVQKHLSILSLLSMIYVVITGPLCDIVYYSLYRSLNALNLRRLCSSIRQTTKLDLEQLTIEFLSGLMRIQTDAFEILQFILSFIPDDFSGDQDEIELTLRDCSQYILQRLCNDCHCKFRVPKDNQKIRLPILSILTSSFDQFLQLLNLTKNPQKIQLINDLCFNIALYNGEQSMNKYLQYIFTQNTIINILQDIYLEFEYFHPNSIFDTLNRIFEETNELNISICLENLLQLLLLDERSSSNSRSIQMIIWSLIDHFSRLLSGDFQYYYLILEIYFHLKIYQILPTYEQILQLACSFTDIHMRIIENNDENLFEHLLLWRDALMNFIHFNNPDFQLFFLITSIDFLVPKLSPFDKIDDSNLNRRSIENSNSLLEQNIHLNKINSNRLPSRSFRRQLGNDRFIKIPLQYQDQHIMLMTSIFHELLLDNDKPQKSQLFVCLATTLIENILSDSTIDVQFDDDQCKTPNERNLALIRRLDEQPFVWILLEILATDNNAFQICLPIIRCLLSALVVQWENFRGEDRAKTYVKQLTLSTNLLILLKKARILPNPLNEIYELFPFITAYDCFTLLSNLWNYFKQNQQNLTMKTSQQNILREATFYDPIRFVIQKNIADVGHIAEHFLHLQLQTNV